jgi:hypothetical protein
MGPVEVTAGAVVLLAVLIGVWVVAARRRSSRRRRDEAERGTDDAAMRAEVLERLERAAAEWDAAAGRARTASTGDSPGNAGTGTVEVDRAAQDRRTEPAESRPEARPEVARAADEPARHGRPGRRIRLRWHPHA